jgi:CPA2 family monovalent cation:H+ antiporter-2
MIGLVRNYHVYPNPKSSTTFMAGDIVGLIGDTAQVAAAERMIAQAQADVRGEPMLQPKPA